MSANLVTASSSSSSLLRYCVGAGIVVFVVGYGAAVWWSFALPGRSAHHRRSPRAGIKAIEQAIVTFQTDGEDACPTSIDALFTLRYLTKPPLDAWGEPFAFTCPGLHNADGADIVSKGPDRLLGTADDLRSWEP